jgi:hypothetical protein
VFMTAYLKALRPAPPSSDARAVALPAVIGPASDFVRDLARKLPDMEGTESLEEVVAAVLNTLAAVQNDTAQPRHLVRRGLRPDGTYPPADDDEAPQSESAPRMWNERAADRMAAAVDVMVRRNVLDPRSLVADARLDYGQPFTNAEKVLEDNAPPVRAETPPQPASEAGTVAVICPPFTVMEVDGDRWIQDSTGAAVAIDDLIPWVNDELSALSAHGGSNDTARLDYLERELDAEVPGRGLVSLFRRNVPITRAAIDEAMRCSSQPQP